MFEYNIIEQIIKYKAPEHIQINVMQCKSVKHNGHVKFIMKWRLDFCLCGVLTVLSYQRFLPVIYFAKCFSPLWFFLVPFQVSPACELKQRAKKEK